MDDYIVQPGDTLPGVAERCLGNSGRWDEISRLNNLVGPVNLYIGQRLVLPPDAYTCTKSTTQLNYSKMPPNASFASEGDQRPATLMMARGFMFIIIEQLPDVASTPAALRHRADLPLQPIRVAVFVFRFRVDGT